MWKLDKGSETKLATVKAELQMVARKAVELSSLPFAIVSGNRTQAEQDRLYAQGRTRRGSIVTKTRNSKHIGGRAVDFAVLDSKGKVDWHNLKPYPTVAAAFKAASQRLAVPIEWGGDWAKWKDWGHIQLKVKQPMPGTISEIQGLLLALGYKVRVTGKYAEDTVSAVKAFQRMAKLIVDGIVGPRTWSAMKKDLSK